MNKKYISYILSALILIISVYAVGNNNKRMINSKSIEADKYSYEMKGVWVSYITLDMQNTDKSEEAFTQKINKIIENSKSKGFNTLIVQVRPYCDAIYNSAYYPWSHILTGSQGKSPQYDPLKIICEQCHKNNMYIHAWINPYRVSSQNTPVTLSQDNPYVMDKSIGFVHNNAIYLDPSNQKAQQLIINGVKEIVANYNVDGIQFDDYFYPEDCDTFDDEQYNKYKESTNSPLPKELWRAQNVNDLIEKVYDAIHDSSDNVIFGISPQGNIDNNLSLGADVRTWLKYEGYIDYIAPQIYFSFDNPALGFEDCLYNWLKTPKHEKLLFYVGLAGYKAGSDEDNGTWLDSDDILKNQIEICKENKLDGIMLYSYESLISQQNEAEIKNVANYLNGIS